MSILFCTPMYGNQCIGEHHGSILELQRELILSGFDHDFLRGYNESLITRGRDKMAATFLKTDFQYMMWIDADISFSPDDVGKLWDLCQKGAKVAVGAYKMKQPDSVWTAWVRKETENGWQRELVDVQSLNTITEVDYAGTGFMMIHRSVYEDLINAHPDWKYTEDEGEIYGFYQDPVKDGWHASEDYFFCEEWRKLGGKILLDPTISLKHWGLYGYGE